MRATISLLVTSLTFGTLTLGCQTANGLTFLLEAESQIIQASRVPKRGKPQGPKKPAPHRGSGRRELREFVFTAPAV